MRREYNLKVPRFDPYKNIYIGVDSIIKICTKCGERKPLAYETYGKDSQREYGYQSQCRECKNSATVKYNRSKV